LLDANPLEDIRNTHRIRAVVIGGKVLQRADLDAMLAGVASAIKKQTGCAAEEKKPVAREQTPIVTMRKKPIAADMIVCTPGKQLRRHVICWETEGDTGGAWFFNFGKGSQSLYRHRDGDKSRACSVRCIKP